MSMSQSAVLTSLPAPDEQLVGKFQTLADELAGEVFEAEERILGALCALVAREHMAMIGAPGTAKTFLVDRMMKRITGVRFYSELMRKTAPPEIVYGQVSIQGMKVDDFHYVTKGFLPEADVALVDEFTRTSDAINNGMLTILNERRFKNGATDMAVPLATAFLCANSLPVGVDDEQDLEAFWDRVVMRFIVDPPVERATWRRIARLRLPDHVDPVLTWDEVLVAQQQARELPIADACYDAIDEIRDRMEKIGIPMSPRRVRQAQYVAAAAAWLDGAAQVTAEHCDMLRHMLWEVPEQRAEVDRIVAAVVSPALKQAVELSDGVVELTTAMHDALDGLPDTRGICNELFEKVTAVRAELDDFMRGTTGRALRTVEAASRSLNLAHADFLERAYGVTDPKILDGLRG